MNIQNRVSQLHSTVDKCHESISISMFILNKIISSRENNYTRDSSEIRRAMATFDNQSEQQT